MLTKPFSNRNQKCPFFRLIPNYTCLDVGLPVAGLEVEVEGEALRALELGQADVAGRARLVAPHHLPAVALRSHPKVLRVRPVI